MVVLKNIKLLFYGKYMISISQKKIIVVTIVIRINWCIPLSLQFNGPFPLFSVAHNYLFRMHFESAFVMFINEIVFSFKINMFGEGNFYLNVI